uniref:ABC transporter domain-containing protein n=1 Tax=Pyrodinium bahamense TaxID=73915 RepID=A0A7R9ZXU3_9DINO
MDPSSRRELWDLLLRMRAAGRAILFTTHYLEEADVLADRKAVLARGRVQAVGTSRDLKMQFGIGYHLQVELRPAAAEQQLEELQRLITGHVASARDDSVAEEERAQAADAARVARFVLPYDQVARFGPLLLELDAKREALLLQDYSLAMTSLEEVFMALGQQAESQAGAEAGQNADFRELAPEPAPEGSPRTEASERRGAKALATVRLKQFDRRSVYSTIILPCIFIVLSFANQSSENQSAGVNAAIYPSMAFSISAISFTMQLLKDKQSKCKYVAIAQGLSVRSYWLGTFTAHYLVSLPVALLMSMLIAYKPPLGVMDDDLPLVFLMTLVYPVSLLAYAYNFSLFFTTVEVAVKVLPLSNLFLGTIPTALVAVLLPMRGTNGVAVAIHAVMSVVNPLYGLPGTIVFLMYTPIPGAGAAFASWGAWPLYGSLLALPLLTANLMWWDARSRTARPGDLQAFGNERKDEDVLAEEGRVERNPIPGPEEAVRYVRLSHTYRTKVRGRWVQTPAVRGISLGVRSGECFGLLGPNGAGKTTTLAVLTGEVRPATAGRLIVCGHDISHPAGLAAAYKTLGVCPQVDPLWDTVTGREHLLFYGRVKGIPESTLYGVASGLLYRLGFDDTDMDKAAGKYSGGMKRKLSLGIALIGHSSLLFLDEPSAAVDAGAKRHLWRVIKLRRRDQTVVLTTHSMEEAEALCDRIAIQVHGQLRCLGSPLQIKNKYGSGYQLELFAVGAGDAVTDFVRTKLTREASLLECHAGRYLFQLPPMGAGSALTLGRVFTELQQNMQAVGITDYSLTQPSLEQVFIRFAREQETEVDTSEVPASAAPATSARDVPLLVA